MNREKRTHKRIKTFLWLLSSTSSYNQGRFIESTIMSAKNQDYPNVEHIVMGGYLAEYKDSDSLAEGVKWVLEDESRTLKLRETARKKAVKEHASEMQAKRYISLYEKAT